MCIRDSPITVRSLHVQGQLDTVTESSQVKGLYTSCKEGTSTFLEHSGGHFVPNSKGFVLKIADWLQNSE